MDLFDLSAKITLDSSEYEKGLNKASKNTSRFGKTAGKLLKTAGIAIASAMTTGATAAFTIGKQAIENFKTYEQLIGGAQLLFGNAYDTVAKNAANAYKNVQMSQNDYLNAVNGYAVGLRKSLKGDEQAAADLADRIITAQADIVAATGKDAETVQNAFSGLMRNNLTMLDNLGLGPEIATKKGFQAMMKAVNAWNKEQGRATKYQMGNLADMEAALVDYVEMVGLAGYAQREAGNTIEGSLASTKAAWSDLLTGFASENADIDGLINNLVEQATNLADQIEPRIESIMSGLTKFLEVALPEVIPLIKQFISENADDLAKAGVEILTALIVGFVDALPEIVDVLPDLFKEIKSAIEEHGDELKEAGNKLLTLIWDGIVDVSVALIEWLGQLGESILVYFGEAFETLWGEIEFWVGEFVIAGKDFINGIIEGMQTGFETLVTNIATWVQDDIITPLREWISDAISTGTDFVNGIIEGMQTGFESLLTNVETWIQENIITPLTNGISAAVDVGKQVVDNIKEGINKAWDGLVTWFNGIWDRLFGKRSINVTVNETEGRKSAIGLDYVPFNDFPATLHKGEAVLTAREADEWRRGTTGGSIINLTQNINAVAQTPVQLAAATAAYFEQARWAI